jgi:mannose-6-phosphate isomerase-like protein (cupin superfamily)
VAAQSLPSSPDMPPGVVLWKGGVPPASAPKADFGDHLISTYMHADKPAVPEAHADKDDIFYIQSGSADFEVGGTATGMHETSPGETLGTEMTGATRVRLTAGDVITIPAGMPHRYLTKPGEKITYFITKVVKRQPITPPPVMMEGLPPGVIHWANGTPPQGLQYKQSFGDHTLYGYHREKSGAIEDHDFQDDVFLMEKGAADFLVGGTGVGMHVSGKGEQQGSSIDGATRVHLTAGDVITIPAGMPHQFVFKPGDQMDYFIIKIVKPEQAKQ